VGVLGALDGAPQYESGWYFAALAVLLYQPVFMGILLQYVLYLLASPWLIRLVVQGRAVEVATASVLLWLAVQLGAHLPLAAAGEALLRSLDPSLSLARASTRSRGRSSSSAGSSPVPRPRQGGSTGKVGSGRTAPCS
jgi:hypothetical protein